MAANSASAFAPLLSSRFARNAAMACASDRHECGVAVDQHILDGSYEQRGARVHISEPGRLFRKLEAVRLRVLRSLEREIAVRG